MRFFFEFSFFGNFLFWENTVIKNSYMHFTFIQIYYLLTFCPIGLVICCLSLSSSLSTHVHNTHNTHFFPEPFLKGKLWISCPLSLNISLCVPKNKDDLLYNHSTMINCYNTIIYSPYSNFTNCPNNAHYIA